MRGTPLSYWPVKAGLSLLVFTLIISAIGLYKETVPYSESKMVGPGVYTLGNHSLETKYFCTDRTLQLFSKNATVIVSWDGSEENAFNITTNVTLNPAGTPIIKVISGNVSYEYRAIFWRYPYSFLVVPAFVSMLLGTTLVVIGYIKLNERMKGR